MSHLNFSIFTILAFLMNFCPLNVNLARFARNVECDFFLGFSNTMDILTLMKCLLGFGMVGTISTVDFEIVHVV